MPRPVTDASEDPLPLDIPDSPEERLEHFQARATQEGKKAHDLARVVLERAGFEIVTDKPKVKGAGVQFDFLVASSEGRRWYVDVSGAFTTVRPGLMRTDTLWKALGRIHVVKQLHDDGQDRIEVMMLTSNLPKPGSEGDTALRAAGPSSVFDAIEMFDDRSGVRRLHEYAGFADSMPPLAGFWTAKDVDDRYDKV